ncbi:MAG: ATP-binding cassette domain-containing protein [Lachnospiraceae bacterium]|nr:ATP-binding cassette domain-containing protein [Lachnospiraceae bacterium]
MSETIDIIGIETHNLKNIDISLRKKEINLIIGPSGSGKSSLAYDTVAQIGQHEFLSMFDDGVSEPTYKVRSYSNMIAAVPVQQSNHNNNIRSTIGTYFGLNRYIALIYAVYLGLGEDLFVLNKIGNLCEYCHGLGVIKRLDENKLVRYDVPLEKNPIKCWYRYKDFYSQIIMQFCLDYDIDFKKSFRQLTEKERNLFLYGESKEKYSIRYKKASSFSRRTTKYFGIMTGMPMMSKFSPAGQFYSDFECEHCKGAKYSLLHEQYKLVGISIGSFMTTSFQDLDVYISKMTESIMNPRLKFALDIVHNFVKKAIELNLGHLFFHRSIPTLSGGELQRLRLVQVFNTQLSDLLIVLDEPLAGLSGSEKHSVYSNIVSLATKHTLLIVDHSDIFVKNAKVVIALGEKSGKDGGALIDANQYLKNQEVGDLNSSADPTKLISVSIRNIIYQFSGVEIQIAEDSLSLISGKSGVGKSTLLREYFPQFFEGYVYINQKPLQGNRNSSVATVLDVFSAISEAYAKKYGKEKQSFSNLTGCEGACPICAGAGFIDYGSSHSGAIQFECRDCEGTGFNKNLKKFKLYNKDFFEIWNMTIDEAIVWAEYVDKKIAKTFRTASEVLLGHLRVGQFTSTLSGGENIRIKLLKSAKTSAKVLGIDEPFKGLSNTEILCVVKFLERLRKDNKIIIVADHNEASFRYFTKHLTLSNENGILVGSDILSTSR